jgi:hypothetical protein
MCRFSRRNFEDIPQSVDQTIRGLCLGLLDSKQTLAMECCEPFGPTGRRDPRRISVEFLPHQAGHNLTYDVAAYPVPSRKEVASLMRQIHYQRDAGKTEVVVTHLGMPQNKSLFSDPSPDAWVNHKRTRKGLSPGVTFFHRVYGGFVQLGQDITRGGSVERVWEPALKVGARTGDSWRWTNDNVDHDYQVVQFTEHRSRPAVVIAEKLTSRADIHHPTEVRHTYVKDVGEVERREVRHISEKERSVIAERRLVEDANAPPPKSLPSQSPKR